MLNPAHGLIDFFAETDPGLARSANEDSLILHVPGPGDPLREKGALALVADGVGGANSGKTASSLAVSIINETYYASPGGEPLLALKESVRAAHREIQARSRSESSLEGMATTCTAFVLRGPDGYVCHAGDSRAYLFRDGSLRQVTEDHTLVNRLLQDGLLTEEAARSHPQRNIIVKALGSDGELEPDTIHLELEENDIILLSSDGLHGLVSDSDIASALARLPLREAGMSLMDLAKANGGTDNISVILLRTAAGKTPGKSATRPFRAHDRENVSTLLTALVVALLIGGLLYLWASRGLDQSTPPSLDEVLKISK